MRSLNFSEVDRDYSRAKARLILLDYDGTLIPFDMHPKDSKPTPFVKSILRSLTDDPRNCVVLISGRDKENLEARWNDLRMMLVAEHGAFYKQFNSDWKSMFSTSVTWMPQAIAALNALSFQYPGSFVEKKIYSIAWHYRAIADRITPPETRQILAALRSLPMHSHFAIYDHEYTIELRSPEIDKGSFVARWMGVQYFDFIMAIGDSQTDEDLFRILDQNSYSIRVGKSDSSSAQFFLENQAAVLPFLQEIVNAEQAGLDKIKLSHGGTIAY